MQAAGPQLCNSVCSPCDVYLIVWQKGRLDADTRHQKSLQQPSLRSEEEDCTKSAHHGISRTHFQSLLIPLKALLLNLVSNVASIFVQLLIHICSACPPPLCHLLLTQSKYIIKSSFVLLTLQLNFEFRWL